MQYTLLFVESAAEFAQRENPDQAPAYWGAWSAYIAALGQAGVIVSSAGLQPPATATTVRVRDGQRQVHDGPTPSRRKCSAASSSSKCRTSISPSNGLRVRRPRATPRWKSDPCCRRWRLEAEVNSDR